MEKPNYYAILSAEIRYDNRLRPNVKLLYAEITALCNMNRQCFASNRYFAELYGKSKGTISGWINELIKYGYVAAEYTYKNNTKEIDKRYIKILKGGITENNHTLLKKTLKNNTIKDNTNITYSNNEKSTMSKLDIQINEWQKAKDLL
jgi:transposase